MDIALKKESKKKQIGALILPMTLCILEIFFIRLDFSSFFSDAPLSMRWFVDIKKRNLLTEKRDIVTNGFHEFKFIAFEMLFLVIFLWQFTRVHAHFALNENCHQKVCNFFCVVHRWIIKKDVDDGMTYHKSFANTSREPQTATVQFLFMYASSESKIKTQNAHSKAQTMQSFVQKMHRQQKWTIRRQQKTTKKTNRN